MKKKQEPQAGKQVSLLIELSRRGWSDDIVDEILSHMPPLKNTDWNTQEEAAGKILALVMESVMEEECIAGLGAM